MCAFISLARINNLVSNHIISLACLILHSASSRMLWLGCFGRTESPHPKAHLAKLRITSGPQLTDYLGLSVSDLFREI